MMDVLHVYCFKSVGSYKHKLSRIESLVILYWGINCIQVLSIFAAFSITTTCNLCNKHFSHFTLHQLSNCFTVEAWDSTVGISVPTWRDGNQVFRPMTSSPRVVMPQIWCLDVSPLHPSHFSPQTMVVSPHLCYPFKIKALFKIN